MSRAVCQFTMALDLALVFMLLQDCAVICSAPAAAAKCAAPVSHCLRANDSIYGFGFGDPESQSAEACCAAAQAWAPRAQGWELATRVPSPVNVIVDRILSLSVSLRLSAPLCVPLCASVLHIYCLEQVPATHGPECNIFAYFVPTHQSGLNCTSGALELDSSAVMIPTVSSRRRKGTGGEEAQSAVLR